MCGCGCVCLRERERKREISGATGARHPAGSPTVSVSLKDTVLVLHSGPRWTHGMKSPRLRTGPGGLYSEGGGGRVKGHCMEKRKGYACVFITHSDPGTGSGFVAQGIPWTLPTELPMPTPLPPRQPVPDVHPGATGADGEADGRDRSSWAGPLPGS